MTLVLIGLSTAVLSAADVRGEPSSAVEPNRTLATTWFVSPAGSDATGDGTIGNPWRTITWAVGQATVVSGDTIDVAAGSYAEAIVLTKRLTIRGAQWGNDARLNASPLNTAVNSVLSPTATTILTLAAGSAASVIDGLTFAGGTRGIESTAGPIDTLVVRNNYLVGFTGSAIFLNDNGVDVTIHQNVCDAVLKVGNGDTVHLDQDTFHGLNVTCNIVTSTSVGNAPGTGIFVDGNHNVGVSPNRGPLLSQNVVERHVTGANLGRFAFTGTAATQGIIEENTFRNNTGDGLQGGIQRTLIRRNTFQGNGGSGLALTGFSGSVSADPTRGAQNDDVTENIFTGNVTRDLNLNALQFPGTISTNKVHGNTFGSATAAQYNGTETIDCSANWWGSATGPALASHPSGAGNAIAGTGNANLDFTPWFNTGTDVDGVTAGFQGDYGFLWADDDSIQSGATLRIQEALTLVLDTPTRGTVRVRAGTYAEAVIVNKWVKLQGDGDGANPAVDTIVQTAAGSRLDIQASGTGVLPVEIVALNLVGGTHGINLSGIRSHVRIDDCTCQGSTGNGIEINGAVDDLVVNNVDLINNTAGAGLRVGTTGALSNSSITGGNITGNDDGVLALSDLSSTTNQTGFVNVSITGTNVSNNGNSPSEGKGLYFEKASNVTLSALTVNANGTGSNFPGGVLLNLKRGTFGSTSITNCVITNTAAGPSGNGRAISVDVRNDGANGPTTFAPGSGVTITNCTCTGSVTGILVGEEGTLSGTCRVKIQGSNLTSNTSTGLFVFGNAVVDAGDCANTNITGLGSSTGGNTFTGYGYPPNGAPPFNAAILGANAAGGPNILAFNNNFGLNGVNNNFETYVIDGTDNPALGQVLGSQSGGLFITCPPGSTISCAGSVTPPAASFAAFLAAGGTASSTTAIVGPVTDDPLSGGGCGGSITRHYNLTDSCGNSAACTQVFTVNDTTPPTITNCLPASLPNVSAGGTCQGIVPDATVGVTATDNCTPSGSLVYSQAPLAGSALGLGTHTIVVTVTDLCGRSSTCSRTVTIVDATPPTLTCNVASATINLDAACQALVPNFVPTVTTTDGCSPPVVITQNPLAGTVITGPTAPGSPIIVQMKATDAAGNVAICNINLNVRDVTPPTIICNVSTSKVFVGANCTASMPDLRGFVTAGDNCNTVTPVVVAQSPAPGTLLTPTQPMPNQITVVFTATDGVGLTSTCSMIFDILDNTPPTVTPGSISSCYPTVGAAEAAAIAATGATDNCDTNLTKTASTTGTCSATVTVTVTDDSGNFAIATYTTRIDNTPPTITCPGPVAVSCASLVPPAAIGSVMTSDNCSGPITVTHVGDVISAQTCANRYTITRTYQAADGCGNTATCTQTITVDDQTPPSISCPAAATVGCAADVPAVDTGSVMTSDGCGGTVTVTHLGDVISAQTCANRYTITRTYQAADVCGNTATCTQTITVNDITPPSLTCPAPVTVSCASAVPPPNTASVTATDTCGGVVAVSFVGDVISAQTCVNRYTITRTYQGMDVCGNTATCTQTITVNDTTLPVLTCPASVSLACDQPHDPWATGTATATDDCGSVTVTWDDDRSGLSGCNATGTIARTWTATDLCGNVATCVQTITIFDNIAPVMTPCPSNIAVGTDAPNCSATVTYTAPTAVDKCYFQGFEVAGFISDPLQRSTDWNNYNSLLTRVASGTNGVPSQNGVAHADIASTGPLPAPPNDFWGAFTRLGGYTSTFGLGFRSSVDVYLDMNDPQVLTSNALTGYGWDLSTAASNTSGGHRRDFVFHAASYGGNTITIGASNNSSFTRRNDLGSINHVTLNTTGWYTFEWIFRNQAGVLAVDLRVRQGNTVLFTETRSDPSDLIPSVVGGNRYMWFTFLEVEHLAIDNTCLERNVPVVCSLPSGSTFGLGSTTVTCTADDGCPNNTTSCTFDVTVTDDDPPVMSCPSNLVLECGPTNASDIAAWLASATANDNCGTATVSNDFLALTPGCGLTGTATVVFTAVDTHSLTSTCTRTITVQDTTAPTLSCPANLVLECGPTNAASITAWLQSASATDACGSASVSNDYAGLTPGCGLTGTATVVFTAVDACGRTSTCTRTITVQDTIPPALNCPMPLTLECGPGNAAAITSWLSSASATDSCGPAVVTNNFTALTPTCGNAGTATVLFTATDACGHASTCTSTITVTDTTPPTLDCPTNLALECGPGNAAAITAWLASASATDTCGTAVVTNNYMALTPTCGNAGTATVVFTATDGCGLTSTCTRTITVTDTTPPTLSCPANLTLECGAGNALAISNWLATATATDTCGSAAVTHNYTGLTAGCGATGTATVVFTAMDACSNSTTCTRTITVSDTTPPVLTCPANLVLECGPANAGDISAWLSSASAADDCGSATVTHDYVGLTPGCGATGTATVTFTATDACSHTSTCVRTITVQDTTPPVASSSGTLAAWYATQADAGSAAEVITSATDVCGATARHITFVAGAGCAVTVNVTFTDACGNTSNQLSFSTVIDGAAPVFAGCPTNQVYNAAPGECSHAFTWTPPTATDNCSTPSVTSDHVPGEVFLPGTTTVTYTATDACGHVSTCTFTLTINGDFGHVECYPTGTAPAEVAVAELGVAGNTTATGLPAGKDLVTADSGSDSLTVRFNDGTGNFSASSMTIALSSGDTPVAVVVGNFTSGSMGKDLAVACKGRVSPPVPSSVKFLRNTGLGWTFDHAVTLGAHTNPIQIAAGDLDQIPASFDDLAVACQGTLFTPGTAGMGVILNSAAYTILDTSTGGYTPQDVAIGDLNGIQDGVMDIVAVEEGGAIVSPNRVSLYRGTGGGTFLPRAFMNTSAEPYAVCVADMDGDGLTNDLAIGTDGTVIGGQGRVEVRKNLKSGAGLSSATFAAASSTTFIGPAAGPADDGFNPRDLACGDLQRDTLRRLPAGSPAYFASQDVVTANFSGVGGSVSIGDSYNPTTNAFRSQTSICNIVGIASAVALADVDGDTLEDIIVTDQATNGNKVCVIYSRVRALATPFGAGCPGTAGLTPLLQGNNLAVMGQVATVDLSLARPNTAVVLGVSAAIQETQLLPSACVVYLANPIFTFSGLITNGAGNLTFPFAVPNVPSPFLGAEVYFQAAVSDPFGSYVSTLAFSNALRVRLGF